MKTLKNKTMGTMIALILMLTIIIPLYALPTTNAHNPPQNVTTFAFLAVGPSTVGVGQTTFLNFWLDKVPPTANVAYGERWENFTIKVTKPDGNTETLGPFASDDVGGGYARYTPTAVGNYSFQMFFPGQTITGANSNPATYTMNPASIGDYYLPSTSPIVTLVVQQEAIQVLPATPLPTDYWSRPINGMNSEWVSIAGDYLVSILEAMITPHT
jgi:hypothetical protein